MDRLSGGRFLLGLGASGPQVVEGLHGRSFARPLGRMRETIEIVRLALEHYLDDFQDLSLAAQRLRDPSDPILDWDEVRDAVVGKD